MTDSEERLPTLTEADFRAGGAAAKRSWYARRPPQQPTDVALDQLHSSMLEWADLYESGDLDGQRYAVAASLILIQDFLVGQGFSEVLLAPSYRPIEALHDQDNNRLDPMFSKRKGKLGGRPAKSIDRHHRVGILAALAQFWLDTHPDAGKQKISLATAARRMRGRWFGTVTASDLMNARVELSQCAADHPSAMAAKQFRGFIDTVVADFGADSAMAIVIRHLNITPPSPSLGNWAIIKGDPD